MKNTNKKGQIRQGDVYLMPINATEIPASATVRKRDNGRVVLAYGEVTGHAHALTAPGVELLEANGVEFLKVDEVSAALLHEEHNRIDIPQGTYRIVHQREYSPEAIRNVAD